MRYISGSFARLDSAGSSVVEQLDVNQEVMGSIPIRRHLFELTIIDVSYKKRAGYLQDNRSGIHRYFIFKFNISAKFP